MLLLQCPGLTPLLVDAYRYFAEALKVDREVRAFEHALAAPEPDRKIFRDYSRAQGWRKDDMPIAVVCHKLEKLIGKYADELSRALLPSGPTLKSLLGAPDRHILRFSSYPAANEGLLNHAHVDIDLFTLLPAATTIGLEIEDAGGWRAVSPAPDEVLAIAGEFTEMFGGRPAVRHRVLATATPRISASFFVNAAPDLVVGGRSVGEIMSERLCLVGRKN